MLIRYDASPMDWLQIIILSLVQGITEFLPISSSAHLILTPHVFGWIDQGLSFDIAVHMGTLVAVVFYFRHELQQMTGSCRSALAGGKIDRQARLAGYVLIATIPATLVGAVFHDQINTVFRNPMIIAAATIVFGLALLSANRERVQAGSEHQITLLVALAIGLAQTVAFIPGTSRSGITMLAAVLLGLRRDAAARFSFLMSIPIILGAGLYKTILLARSDFSVDWVAMTVGAFLAAVSALMCIHLFLRFIEKVGFTPFVIYRLLLGAVLVVIFV